MVRTLNRQLVRYMDQIMDECLGGISVAEANELARYAPPTPFMVKVPGADLIQIACRARREGAKNRAEAIEWAYDVLIRKSGFFRTGEVVKLLKREVVYYEALCQEK